MILLRIVLLFLILSFTNGLYDDHRYWHNSVSYFVLSNPNCFRKVGVLTFVIYPLGLCPDWESWDPKKPVDNAREAMQQADDWLGVPQV